MRVAFDLDGTIADLQGALARVARDLFPKLDLSILPLSPLPSEGTAQDAGDEDQANPPDVSLMLSVRQERQLWKAVCDRANFWETLEEIEAGSLERLSRLARERRWEIIFLTSRPETRGDTAQTQSHRWLIARGFSVPSVFVVHGSRGSIATALQLDVLVDDRPENCLDVAVESTACAILVWRGGEQKVLARARQLGIVAVSSIGECLDMLDREEQDRGGVLKRLKRRLGLASRTPRTSRASAPNPAD